MSSVAVALLSVMIAVSLFSFVQSNAALSTNVFFPSDSKPYSFTYQQWSAKWWQWLLPIPISLNPSNDNSGKNCAEEQHDANVWFLAGTATGSSIRTCTVPAGKAIFFPILTTECSYLETPRAKTESDLRTCAVEADKGATVTLSIDGLKLTNPDLEKYHVQSPLFDLRLAEDNIYGIPGGMTKAVSDGYWIFLKPLAPGKHDLHFSGNVVANPTTGTTSYATETTYHLTIK